MSSVLKRAHKLLLPGLLLLFSGCLSVDTRSSEELYSYLSADSQIIGEWNIGEDETGREIVAELLELDGGIVDRIDHVVFGLEISDDRRGLTALLTGRWSKSFVSFLLGLSSAWEKEESAYVSRDADLWLSVENGLIILSNYRYHHPQPGLLSPPLYPSTFDLSPEETRILSCYIDNRGLSRILEGLQLRSLIISVLRKPDDEHLADLSLEFGDSRLRRLMTPLAKLSVLALIRDLGSERPESSGEDGFLNFSGIGIDYKKLLERYLALVL